MIPQDKVAKSKQVKALAERPTNESRTDTKSNVKSTAREVKKAAEKDLKEREEKIKENDEDDSVCFYAIFL